MSDNLLAQELAKRFARELYVDLSSLYGSADARQKLAEIDRRNASESESSVCHSHDFVDANETMLTALAPFVNESEDRVSDLLILGDAVERSESDRRESDRLNTLWRNAWDFAKSFGFCKLTGIGG